MNLSTEEVAALETERDDLFASIASLKEIRNLWLVSEVSSYTTNDDYAELSSTFRHFINSTS